MAFPFSYSGTIDVDKNKLSTYSTKHISTLLQENLRDADAIEIESSNDVIRFRTPIWTIKGRFLSPISLGIIRVFENNDRITISYKLTYTFILCFITFAVFGFIGPFILLAKNLDFVESILILASFWIYLMGSGYILSIWKFKRCIEFY